MRRLRAPGDETLQRLREGEIKRAAGAKVGVRVYDNATALRLLAAHRESVTRQQAIRGYSDASELIAQINARIAKLRRPVPALELAPQARPAEQAEPAVCGDETDRETGDV